jgi:hypothetical protein
VTEEDIDDFIADAEMKQSCNDDWWNIDFYEEAIRIGKEMKELLAKPKPAPIKAWMINCNGFKCGCQGNPQWHADKATRSGTLTKEKTNERK